MRPDRPRTLPPGAKRSAESRPALAALPAAARQRGFGLVAALFVILIVAAAITAMARLASTQTASVSLGLQQARAYQAARAGLEWGMARALGADNLCESAPTAFDLDGFRVRVVCTGAAPLKLPEEGDREVVFYSLSATAEYASAGSPDYVYRQLTAVLERRD